MSAAETSFFVTGGTLRHDAPSYVERQADRDLSEGLLAGEFCYVLTPRQMGKSSLMVRTASKLREQGVNVIALDLTAIGQNLTAEQWYDGLLARMGRQLKLDENLERFWREHERLGPCQRLFMAIRDVVLRQRPGPLAIFVDEIDSVRSLPFSTDEFFAAMRECYNRRAVDPELSRVTFCLLGVATPSDLVRDTRTTPFNIGRRIELHDFTRVEAAPLAQGLRHTVTADGGQSNAPAEGNAANVILTSGRLLTRILYWTGGHPYLTQRFCRAVAEDASLVDATGVDRICEDLFLSSRARERDDNLLFVRERLLRSETDLTGLLELYRKVRGSKTVPDDETSQLISVLRLSGIVASEAGFLRERNRIYSRVFDEEWIRVHLPDADMRRQRAAFRRGVIRTTAIAAVVVAALTVAVLSAVKQAARARQALAQSYLSQAQAHFSQAQATRKSGVSGLRYESLNALRDARSYYTNKAVLRDEVIACLALVDLKQTNGRYSLKRTDVIEVNLDSGVFATAETDGAITLRSLQGGQSLMTLPASGLRVAKLRFGPKEPVMVAEYHGGSKNQIIVWDWQKGQKMFTVAHGIHKEAIDFSPDGRKLAVGQSSGRVALYSVPEGKALPDLELRWESGLPRIPHVVRFSPSGDLLAESCLDDPNVQIWDLNTGQKSFPLFHPDKVYDIAWHPGGEWLVTACGDARVYLWDTNRTDRPVKKLAGHENAVTGVAFNQRGTLIASAGEDETIRLWTAGTERQVTFRLDGERLDRLRFGAKDQLLIATGTPQTNARVWKVLGDEYVTIPMHAGQVDPLRNIDFSPDNRWLAALCGERVTIWDSESGRELGSLTFTNARTAWFSADSRRLIASSDDGLLECALRFRGEGNPSRVEPGAVHCLALVTNELATMAMTLDRRKAAIVHVDEVLLVSLESDSQAGLRRMPIPAGAHYHRLAMHPKGLWMAAMIEKSDSIHLRELSAAVTVDLPTVLQSSEYFTFSPDGKWLVTCWAGEFRFYRVGEWRKPVFAIARAPASTQHAPVAFSGDGTLVALASSPHTVQLVRLPNDDGTGRKVIGTLEDPDRSPLEILAFSPDGRRLAAATTGQAIQLWNLAAVRDRLAELDLEQDWPDFR